MKKLCLIFMLILLFITSAFTARPRFFWIGSYTIDDYYPYGGEPGRGDLTWSHLQAERCVGNFFAYITYENNDVNFKWHHNYRDADVNELVWYDEHFNVNEFVIFVGHGAGPGILVNYSDNTQHRSWAITHHNNNQTWGYGNDFTKWVILGSCKTLIPGSANFTEIFHGVHCIMGYKSAGRNFELKGPIDAMPKRWVYYKHTIWDSWHYAVKSIVYSLHGFATEPAIVGVWGKINGVNWASDDEKFDEVYDQLTPTHDEDSWDYGGMYMNWCTYGTPDY